MGITNNTYTLYYEKDNYVEVLDFYKYKENYIRVEYDTVCDKLYILTTEGIDNPDFYATDAGGFPFYVLYDSEDNTSIGIMLGSFSVARHNIQLWTDLLSIRDSELPLNLQDNIIHLRNGMPYTIATVIPMLYEFFLNGHAYQTLGMVEGKEFPSSILVINPFSNLKEHDFDTNWIMGDLEVGIGSTLHWKSEETEEDSPAKKLLEAFEKELAKGKQETEEKPKKIVLELPDDLYIDGKSVNKLLAKTVKDLQAAVYNGLFYERERGWIKNYLQENIYPFNEGEAQVYVIPPSAEDEILPKTYFSIFIPAYLTRVSSQIWFRKDMQASFYEDFGSGYALDIITFDCSAGKDYDDLELCGTPFKIKKEE